MFEDPNRVTENLIREFWRNEMWEDVEDNIDRMMITLLDEEEQKLQTQRNAGFMDSRRFVNRDREDGNSRLVKHYFSENPTFHAEVFQIRFRMRRDLFIRIVDALTNHSQYFQWRRDAVGRQSLSPLQKCTAAIRQLAYAAPADSLDEYVRMGERTALDCLVNFCQCVIYVFGERYLRRPNDADTQRLLQMHEDKHDFPGIFGSIDCMHWEWRNCPVPWKGQYIRGDYGVPTIILEAIASIVMGSTQEFREYLRSYSELCDREAHHQLRADLVEHIWTRYECD